MTVLAIDQGTSSTKALVVSADGRVLGEGSAPVTPRPRPDGAVTQDPEELYTSVLTAGRAALAAAGDVEVEAVGIGNQGETVLAWDRDTGRAVGPAIGWQDRRAAEVTRELAPQAERLAALTGLPLDPYFAGPKLTWLRRTSAAGQVRTTIDAWVTHRLCGAYVTDVATASRTMLLDLDRCEWSPEAGAIFGVDVAEQPTVVANAEVVATTDAFGPELPISALIVDQQAALLAQSCFSIGAAKCTYGTGGFLLANAGPVPPRSTAGLAACVAWRLPGMETDYCLDGQVYTVGAAIGWLQRIGLINHPDDLDRLGEAAAPLPSAPLFIPGLAGLGAPDWAPDARGAWLGLSLATTREDLIDAVIWGIAAQITRLTDAVARDIGHPLTALRVDGGLTRSRRLMQAQADLLGVPVAVFASPDATALGIAALAHLGCAAQPIAPLTLTGVWKPVAVYEPQLERDAALVYLARHAAATEARIGADA